MPSAQKQFSRDENTTADPTDLAVRLAAAEERLAAASDFVDLVGAKLAETEDVLRDALQSSVSWLWESDDRLCFTRIVGPVEQILGTPADSLIGKSIEDFAGSPNDPQAENHRATLRARKPYRDVLNSAATRKGMRWVKSSGKPLFDAEGKFLGYRGIASDVTVQVEAERRAAEAHRRFMEAIETVPASLMLCDRDDRIVFCNSATQHYFPKAAHLLVPGTKYEDLLRAHYASGVVNDIGQDIESRIAERMKSHRIGTGNTIRAFQDGHWVKTSESRTSDGGIVSVRIDITELKKREKKLEELSEALRKSREHLAQAQRTSGTGSIERNLQTGEVKWSDECRRIFRRDPSERPPSRDEFLLLMHPDDRAKCDASMIACEQGRQSEPFQFRVLFEDGSVRWFHCETSLVLDSDSKPWKCIGTYRDITTERETQEELRQMAERLYHSQESLVQAQQASHTGSIERDIQTGEVVWSDETYRIFGRALGTPAPRRAELLTLFHPEDAPKYEEAMTRAQNGEKVSDVLLRIVRPDGALRWVQVSSVVMFDKDGTPRRHISAYKDVTEAHAAEEALKAMAADLQRKTAEIEERSHELQRSNADLEQFAYVASHDLQEPLRMVASYCQLLQRRYKDKLDDNANEFIGFAVEGASRMQRLINDLLAYSRVGRKSGDPVPLEFAECVKAALENLKGAIGESSTNITVGALPRVIGVRMQLTQLMQNLIGNAIKFRRDGVTPAVTIAATPDGAMWHIVVEDNGIGIEQQYLDRVFLIFQRLHARDKYHGTGIGLAIAKKVIEYHGGRIWIESTPGQGSRFNFTLPAAIQNGASNV